MTIDDLSESGIQRIADASPYFEHLSDMAQLIGESGREDLARLERCLHEEWRLGQNTILSWARVDDGVLVLVVPNYAIADATSRPDDSQQPRLPASFVIRLISGRRQLLPEQMGEIARLFESEPVHIKLKKPISDSETETQIVERMVRRYGVNYVASRAVTLFDIVGFGLLTPFEQMTQLNSLSYSLNWALSKMLEQDVSINFARTSTGDGFYVWNRDGGLEANVNLYHFMHIVLADNALARTKSSSRAVPFLRACFHVGSCYEFHQSEGLNPTMHDFIVGDVTIELARMIDAALPGQILVG
ncbi:MAG: hypothetical protein HKN49_06750, partial [Gammaproteobacteria bacterium]|nr:hypothetical protein [Gammaproteobacteria bacterium]